MGADKPTVTMADLIRLNAQSAAIDPLTKEGVSDFAVAGLVVLRGLSRADKLKVLRRMRGMLGR